MNYVNRYYNCGQKVMGAGDSSSGSFSISKQRNISDQIDGIKNKFYIGELYYNITVFYCGVNVNVDIINKSDLDFELGFVPRINHSLFVTYNIN
jgi:hypothetical protein